MGRKDLTTERQDEILDAMERCIAKYGLHGTTLNNIASEAKINRGLIHHYVGNRDDVVQLMTERLLERYQSSFKNYAATQPDTDRAEIIIDYYFEAWYEMAPEDDALLLELLAENERDPHIHKLLINLYNGFNNMIARELGQLFPDADASQVKFVSYSIMLLAFGHATINWIGLPMAKQANVRSIASHLVQTLS